MNRSCTVTPGLCRNLNCAVWEGLSEMSFKWTMVGFHYRSAVGTMMPTHINQFPHTNKISGKTLPSVAGRHLAVWCSKLALFCRSQAYLEGGSFGDSHWLRALSLCTPDSRSFCCSSCGSVKPFIGNLPSLTANGLKGVYTGLLRLRRNSYLPPGIVLREEKPIASLYLWPWDHLRGL